MRNIIAKASLFCLLLLIFSCAKKTEYIDPGVDDATHPSLKAKVNGKLVSCEMTSATLYNESPKVMAIMGSKGTEVFSFEISDFNGVGSYSLNNGAATYLISAQGNFANYVSTQGTIKITAFKDKKITGTFEFKGLNVEDNSEKTFSEGSFSLNVTTIGTDPGTNPNPGTNPDPGTNPNPGTSTNMSAKVNGTLLNLKGEGNLIKSSLIGDMMTIHGDDDNTKSVVLSIFNYRGNGTYAISNTSGTGGIYQEGFTPESIFNSTSGSVVVTSSSATTIKGTFSFTASKNGVTKTVTEGKFDVSFTTTSM